MIKDITLGQFFPGSSFIHRLDSRFKIIATTVYIVGLFITRSFWGLFLAAAFSFICYAVAKIPISMILKSLKPIVPLVLFTAILNMFFVRGTVIFSWWILQITAEGLRGALFMSIRIILLISGSTLLTYTTSPIALTDAIEALLKPLAKIKLPVHELAMMMTIALRFIPTLIEETDKIISAQKARGADMESGGIVKRAKALIPILIPLFVSSFRRADELALAMECRCYNGGMGRTRLKSLKFSYLDILGTVAMAIFLAVIIAFNIWGIF